jgi:exodeoxyribonuclease V alpha subunit
MTITSNCLHSLALNTVQGNVVKILYNENGYVIAKLKTADKEQITFKGAIIGLKEREEIILHGHWEDHPQYGKQFHVSQWNKPIPKTKDKIIAFLTSSYVEGCGKKQAQRIVEALGENAIEKIIKEKEKCLLNIKGIGKKRAILIAQSVEKSYELEQLMSKCMRYGIKPEHAVKIYKQYGQESFEIVTKNPYILTDLKLLSFEEADQIAMKMNISPFSGYRIQSCVQYVLNEYCFRYGHCFIEENLLIEQVISILNKNININSNNNNNNNFDNTIDYQTILQSIYALEENTIIIEDGKVYPKNLYIYEEKISKKIMELMRNKIKYDPKKIELYIKEYQVKNNFILSSEQKQAIKAVFENNVLVLTGNPGTGKTTVIKAILDIYQKMFPTKLVSLSAPTGRASRKLKEVTNYEAVTNHRLLGFKQNENGIIEFEHNEENLLQYDFYIIDEMSMVDLYICYSLLQAIKKDAKILFIGDVDQLPSINVGNVLHDLIHSNIPCVRLTEIFRQAKESQIITNAHRINKGLNIQINPNKDDMYFIQRTNDKSISNTIVKSVLRFIELGYSVEDILVLSPIKKGIIGTQELNQILQSVLNPKNATKNEVLYRKKLFREGDKVIQTVNRPLKGVYNGDIGIITKIDKTIEKQDGKEVELEVIECDFQGISVTYKKEDWNDIELAYSITIHKSQGGQAPIVIIPISKSHSNLTRNLIYTGMTRAEQKLVLIGDPEAVEKAIKTNRITKRNSTLSERINEKLSFLQNSVKKFVEIK